MKTFRFGNFSGMSKRDYQFYKGKWLEWKIN